MEIGRNSGDQGAHNQNFSGDLCETQPSEGRVCDFQEGDYTNTLVTNGHNTQARLDHDHKRVNINHNTVVPDGKREHKGCSTETVQHLRREPKAHGNKFPADPA